MHLCDSELQRDIDQVRRTSQHYTIDDLSVYTKNQNTRYNHVHFIPGSIDILQPHPDCQILYVMGYKAENPAHKSREAALNSASASPLDASAALHPTQPQHLSLQSVRSRQLQEQHLSNINTNLLHSPDRPCCWLPVIRRLKKLKFGVLP